MAKLVEQIAVMEQIRQKEIRDDWEELGKLEERVNHIIDVPFQQKKLMAIAFEQYRQTLLKEMDECLDDGSLTTRTTLSSTSGSSPS